MHSSNVVRRYCWTLLLLTNDDIERLSQLCQTALNAMVSAAPRSDLEYCQTAKGATWQNVVDCFCLYFETRDAAKLNLGDSPITYAALMGAMAQFVKQVLTWHLTNGNAYGCVHAMVCFNSEGSALGAKAICYLSHDSSGTADGVVFALNGCVPTMKYTGRSKPSNAQLAAGKLASQKRRSDEMGFQVKRTKKTSRAVTAVCVVWWTRTFSRRSFPLR